MKNSLFKNYVALGEAAVEKVLEHYYAYRKSGMTNMVDDIKKIFMNDYFRYFLPLSKVDGKKLMELMEELIEETPSDVVPERIPEFDIREIWNELEVTEIRDRELGILYCTKITRLIQDICDFDKLELLESVYEPIKNMIDKKIEKLSEERKLIVKRRYGLDGKPCMAYQEIAELLDEISENNENDENDENDEVYETEIWKVEVDDATIVHNLLIGDALC